MRGVSRVDDEKRQIWFSASGMYPGKDPYFVNYYRIDFDGTGLTRSRRATANHAASFSEDGAFFVDVYSRVDLAPVSELRRGDGWIARHGARARRRRATPESRLAAARGVHREGPRRADGHLGRASSAPRRFDPRRKYPVIENIYAGPHGSFVPKSFSAFNAMQAQAELGFIVVQIDGMGTSNRSKAFHDVAWKNLKDAGFPDRILWHKAVAAKYPYYDISRVGIYGTSAGGQNALGALLFHPEFYKAAVSAVRVPRQPDGQDLVERAVDGLADRPRVRGLVQRGQRAIGCRGSCCWSSASWTRTWIPSSTMQVVNALVKANKTFDLLVIPGAGHGPGGAYGERKRYDFFVQHLLGVTPPAWNEIKAKAETTAAR